MMCDRIIFYIKKNRGTPDSLAAFQLEISYNVIACYRSGFLQAQLPV